MSEHKHKFSRLFSIDEEKGILNIQTVMGYAYSYKGINYFIHQLGKSKWEICEYTTGLQINKTLFPTKGKARIGAKKYIDKETPKEINKSIKVVCKIVKTQHKLNISHFLIRHNII